MTIPPKSSSDRRLRTGMIALGIATFLVFSASPPLLYFGRSDGNAIVFLVLALLCVAVWGIATGGRRTVITGETKEQFKSKRLKRCLSLSVAAIFIGPIASGAIRLAVVNWGNVHPIDRTETVFFYVFIGFICGCAVTVAMVLSSIFE